MNYASLNTTTKDTTMIILAFIAGLAVGVVATLAYLAKALGLGPWG